MITFADLLKDKNIPTAPENHHHAREGWLQFDCPFCSPDQQKYRMGYNTRSGYCNCWSCGFKSLADVIGSLFDVSWAKAHSLLKDVITEHVFKDAKKRGKLELPKGLTHLLGAHERYLKGRKFNPDELVKTWKIQGIGLDNQQFRWRIFIPIMYRGELVSWTTRSISEKPKLKIQPPQTILRYKSAKEDQEVYPHKELLYGEDMAQHRIVVCEGPTDAWAVGPGAVATFGLSVTQAQVEKIAKYQERTIIFDSDDHSQQVAMKLVDQLSAFSGVTNRIVLDSKDLAECPRIDLERIKHQYVN